MRKASKIKKQFLEDVFKKMSIVFMDESWIEKNKKVWRIICRRWEKAKGRLGEELHKGENIIGSYSIEGRLIYNISKKKDTKAFLKHLKKVREKEKREWIIMILDNASIHKTKKVKEYCEENRIIMVYLPPYSSEYNYIEKIWKMIKREFGKIYEKYKDIKRGIKGAIERLRYNKRFKRIDIERYLNIV